MARFSFLFVALALGSMHGALGAPSCKHRGHSNPKHSMISYSTSTTLLTYPANIPSTPTPSPSPTSPPATQPKPTSTPPAAPSSSQPPSSSSSGGSVSDADIAAYLKAHNDFRAKHGAQPLTWSNDLANTAQSWANGCKFEHSHGQYGENLSAGTGAFSIDDGINLWEEEASSYDPNNPTYSHFTQMVWKATTQLGCAVATCGAGTIFPSADGPAKYYVCEYNPPGNVIGEFAQNVQA